MSGPKKCGARSVPTGHGVLALERAGDVEQDLSGGARRSGPGAGRSCGTSSNRRLTHLAGAVCPPGINLRTRARVSPPFATLRPSSEVELRRLLGARLQKPVGQRTAPRRQGSHGQFRMSPRRTQTLICVLCDGAGRLHDRPAAAAVVYRVLCGPGAGVLIASERSSERASGRLTIVCGDYLLRSIT